MRCGQNFDIVSEPLPEDAVPIIRDVGLGVRISSGLAWTIIFLLASLLFIAPIVL